MLRCRTLWLAGFLSAIVAISAQAQEGITWAPNLDAAISMASRQNQLVLVHFWAPGCGPCMELERNVFNKPEVARAIARDFVAVKINAQAMPQTARKYNVVQWPTDVIITPAGYPLHSMVSPQDPRGYVEAIYRVAAQRRPGVRISANTLGEATNTAAQDGWGREPAEQAVNQFAQRPLGATTDNRFTAQDPRTPGSGNAWGGQPSNFGPTYGDQVGAPDPDPRMTNPAAEPGNQFAPRETVNPYIDQQQPRPNVPQGNQGIDGRSSTMPRVVPQGMAKHPPVGLDGYCPVTLITDGKWTKGDERFGIIHRGRLYLFASEASKQTFWGDPDRYAPILSGNDPVEFAETGRIVPGDRKHGVFFRNQIFLFTSEESLQRFWSSPKRYADVAVQAMARASANQHMR